MSDGPHRSLNMPHGWKKLAERADNRAFAPEEVRDTLPAALAQDWRAEVPSSLCGLVRDILSDSQRSLFGDDRAERIEALRRKTAGYALGNTFLARIDHQSLCMGMGSMVYERVIRHLHIQEFPSPWLHSVHHSN